jgi:ribose transport system permease protein
MLAALGRGGFVGAVSAFFVLCFGIHSLIVTLGTAAFMTGVTLWISGGMTVIVFSSTLADWVIKNKVYGISPVFFYGIVVAAIIWYIFEYTTWGRQMLFVGRGREVARLSGIRVDRIRAVSFIGCGFVSGLSGILFLGRAGAMDAMSLQILLLPAYAAAFLGATAIIPGRFNPWGSVLAVLFLETGIRGFQLAGTGTYVQNLFYGGGLVVAVSLSQLVRNRERQEFS